MQDLAAPLADGARIEIITERSGQDALDLIRHDTAHVLAAAMLDLYPGVKISIGPPIEQRLLLRLRVPRRRRRSPTPTSSASRPRCASTSRPTSRSCATTSRWPRPWSASGPRTSPTRSSSSRTSSPTTASSTVSLYTNGPFTDLCRGPHAPSTKRIKAFKLQSVAGAYWRGDADRQQLTRVYGTAFFSKEDLEEHLRRLEEARARDHRRLGPQLGLFTFSEISPGAAFWLPNGTQVFNGLIQLSRDMGAARGYTEVKTPQLYDAELWKTSGHWGKYREHMFVTESEGRPIGAQADELPGPRAPLRPAAVVLPRPARPLLRARAAASRRALGRAARPAARAALLPGRRPRLLHGGADPGRGHEPAWTSRSPPTASSASSAIGVELSTRPDERLGDDALWDHAESALEQALAAHGPRPTRSTRATGPSTARRSTCISRTRSAARGSSGPSSSTTRCPSASA